MKDIQELNSFKNNKIAVQILQSAILGYLKNVSVSLLVV